MSGREPSPTAVVAPAATTVSVRGELVVRRAGTAVPLRPKERSVLAAIALAHPQPIGIDRIVALVWPADAPATARKTVQNHIARIRRTIDELVETSPLGYRFAAGVTLDRSSVEGSDAPLADLPDTPEIDAHRQRIAAHVVAAEEQRWAAELEHGARPELVAELHGATLAEPYRERRWQLLATAHAALGARRDALRACSDARRHLAEVGLVPGDDLLALEQRLLRDEQDPTSNRGVAARSVVHPHRDEPFVGRSDEIVRLHEAWRRAATTRTPQLVVVQGPAGTGKTRLVDEFCRSLPDGTSVLVARHRADGEQALAPIAGAVRPVLGASAAPSSVVAGSEPSTAELTDAVRSSLQFLADHPHVLVLDDAHWASTDAIDVVAAAIDGAAAPTLLVLTSRPLDGGDEPWAALTSVATMHHVTIGELTRDELGELVRAAELEVPPDLDLVYARTTGLPLYASELLRVARLSGRLDALDVPSAIRTWMQRRLTTLDHDTAALARVAAIAGATVDVALVAAASARPIDDVERGCDGLVGAGLLTADLGTGTLRFSHELTRDAITDGMGPTATAGVHRRIADALEARDPPDPALIAHHLVRGGPSVAARAATACIAAGERELASGAWRQAETLFRNALGLAVADDARARALAGLGRALVGREQFADSEAVLRSAIDVARANGLVSVQATATLALAGRAGRGAGVAAPDDEVTALLRSALDGLERAVEDGTGTREHDLLASALERELAIMLLLEDAAAERVALLDRQLARIRRLEPPAPGELAAALLASRYAKLSGTSLSQRLDDLDEVLSLPAAAVGSERLLTAHCYRHEDLVRACERGRAAGALADAEGLVRRFPHPYWNWVTHTWRTIELVDAGDLDAAERSAFGAASLRTGIAEATACLGVNLVNIRLYQRRADEVIPLLRDAVAAHPHIPTYRAVLALCSAETGDASAAERHLDHFVADGLRNLPDDTNRLLALAVLSHTAAQVRAADAVPLLRSALEPYAGQWVVLNCYGGGGAVWGPVEHALARLAALEGRRQQAAAWFDTAEHLARRSPVVLERIRTDRGVLTRASTRRRRPEDRAAS